MSLESGITALGAAIANAVNAVNAAISDKGFQTGDVKYAMRQLAPTGWVFATGTIGNATSGASTRANADCEALFMHIWTEFSVTYAPLYTSAGAPVGKSSAASDWALSRRIQIPDARGRILVAQDNMGGSAAGNVTSAGSGVNATIPGVAGGEETHSLLAEESGVPAHAHAYFDRYYGTRNAQAGTNISVANSSLSGGTYATSNNATQDAAEEHNNMPPVLVLPLFIKL
jgi:hypothetical protein